MHFHVGLDDKVLRCSTVGALAARYVNGLMQSVALDIEDGCRSAVGRCGACAWCRSAEAVWDTFRPQLVIPLTRTALSIGLTLIWDISVPTGISHAVWVGPAEGPYASCSAVDHAHLTEFHHIAV